MDAPVTPKPRSADRDDRPVELFAALALIAPDRESIREVVSLAFDLRPGSEPAADGAAPPATASDT